MRKGFLAALAVLLFTAQADPNCGEATVSLERNGRPGQVVLRMSFTDDTTSFTVKRRVNNTYFQPVSNQIPASGGASTWTDGGGIRLYTPTGFFHSYLQPGARYDYQVCPFRTGSSPARKTPLPCIESGYVFVDQYGNISF